MATPLKHLVAINERKLDDNTDPDYEFQYVDISTVGRGELSAEPETMRFDQAPSRARRLVREGDVLVSTVRTYLRAVWPVDARADGLVASTGFAALSAGRSVDPRYLAWWTQSDHCIEEIVARSVGVSYPAINPDEIGEIAMPTLEMTDQQAIADFLDAETGRVDAAVAAKHSLRQRLELRRRSLIDASTVPYAMDGRADTGSPKPWPVTALKHTARFFTDGDWIEAPFITSSGIRLIQTGNVRRGRFHDQGDRFISDATFSDLRCTEVLPGDVLISRLAGTVGRACVAPSLGVRMVASVDVAIYRPGPNIDPSFLVHFLSSERHLSLASLLARGTTMPRLARSQVGDMPVPLPPLDVQRRVAIELDEAIRDMDQLDLRLTRQIELLKERRQALITAAVTGEMEIPGAA